MRPARFTFILCVCSAFAQTGVWKVTTPGYAHREMEGGRQWFGPDGEVRRAQAGVLLRFFDATPYRGKTVRLRAVAWLESAGMMNRAQLWMRVDRPGGVRGFFDNMADRPIVSDAKARYEIVGEVAADAEWVVVGAILNGSSAVLLEGFALEEAKDVAPMAREPARPLSARGLENLKVFARLYGLVRFFHPANALLSADWNRLAVEGVRAVESAESADELAARLRKLFPESVVISAGAEPECEAPVGLLVQWKHTGFGGGQPGLYKSELISANQAETWRGDVGGGIRVAFSLTMPKLPEMPKAAPARFTGDDRATRLADVILLWNVMRYFYPYFDVVGTDWAAELEQALRRAATDRDGAAFQQTLATMVAALKDGHGYVNGPGGRGVPLAMRLAWVEGKVVNAENGDEVLRIDGRPAVELLHEAERQVSGATPQWIRNRALQEMGAGVGPAQVEVQPFGSRESKVVAVARGVQPLEKRPEKVAELQAGIWYVDLARCEDKDLADAWPKLAAAKGVVFDLRGYPRVSPAWLRHLSEHELQSPQWLVPVVMKPGSMEFVRLGRWDLAPAAPLIAAKRAVMTDGRAISYAESTLGIVEAYKLAEIVGSTTAGTNGNINPFQLPGGYQVTWTGMKVLKHDGSRHHGVGIAPTIPVEPTRAGLAAGRDEVLERAVAAVQ
ncbi:MAG: hypothetical protein HY821_20120 [Acidobacteria bacterium]|nr:hypothetical protein [Acidobacteriota bacterium]